MDYWLLHWRKNLTLNTYTDLFSEKLDFKFPLFLMINDHALTLLSKIFWTVYEIRGFFLGQEQCISRPYRIYMRPQSTCAVYYFWNWKGISDFYSLVWVKEKKFWSILKEKFSISGVPTTLQVKLDRQRNLTLKSRPLVWPQLWST